MRFFIPSTPHVASFSTSTLHNRVCFRFRVLVLFLPLGIFAYAHIFSLISACCAYGCFPPCKSMFFCRYFLNIFKTAACARPLLFSFFFTCWSYYLLPLRIIVPVFSYGKKLVFHKSAMLAHPCGLSCSAQVEPYSTFQFEKRAL